MNLLNTALVGPSGVLTQGNSALVVGYSQSATVATNEINALMAEGSPCQGQLSFMLLGNPNNLVDLGLLPQSATPTIYPYVPSIDPNLNFFLGQPSVTGLSVLSGAVGDVLRLIPPIH